MFSNLGRFAGISVAVLLSCCGFANAQQQAETRPAMLVAWYGPGGIPLPKDPAWKLNFITTYDKGARPVANFSNSATKVMASFILFENLSGHPTSEGCRGDVMPAIRKANAIHITQTAEGTMSDGRGGSFATASHLSDLEGNAKNHDIFVFSGNAKTCTEIHVSTVAGSPDEEKRLSDAIAEFHPDLGYQAAWIDYFGVATELYAKDAMLAAPYFDSALNHMPADLKDANSVVARRLATDVVMVALGRMGDRKRERVYGERAIASDPDYPMYYYHLACADAELGHADDARRHLEQAVARKANMTPGERFPDPSRDTSLLKLEKNKEFWAYVQSIAPPAAAPRVPLSGQTKEYALPDRSGAMQLDLTGLRVTEVSAKPHGNELGIRAVGAELELLAFLFRGFHSTPETATTCMTAELEHMRAYTSTHFTEQANPGSNDTADSATVLMTYADGTRVLHRYFGAGDVCLAIELDAKKGTKRLDLPSAYELLARQGLLPGRAPGPMDQFNYAGALFWTGQLKEARAMYESYLKTRPESALTDTLRAVGTENAELARGKTIDYDGARKPFFDALMNDAGYAMYFYELARADADRGKASEARTHLQRAFDPQNKSAQSEPLPDPKTDESILKLKKDKAFWDWLQTLPRSGQPAA